METYNVLVTDDHDLFREGIKTLLKKMKNLQVIGEARNGLETIKLYDELKPDLLLIDISMPDMNGIEASKEILKVHPEARIIILSMHDDEDYISRCLNVGVKGYVVKSESGTELRHTIESVLKGNNYFSFRAQDVILKQIKESRLKKKVAAPRAQVDTHITQREAQILELIVQGLTSQAIAEKLFISIRTVETHRANIMRKLGVRNAVELVKKALQLNLAS